MTIKMDTIYKMDTDDQLIYRVRQPFFVCDFTCRDMPRDPFRAICSRAAEVDYWYRSIIDCLPLYARVACIYDSKTVHLFDFNTSSHELQLHFIGDRAINSPATRALHLALIKNTRSLNGEGAGSTGAVLVRQARKSMLAGAELDDEDIAAALDLELGIILKRWRHDMTDPTRPPS